MVSELTAIQRYGGAGPRNFGELEMNFERIGSGQDTILTLARGNVFSKMNCAKTLDKQAVSCFKPKNMLLSGSNSTEAQSAQIKICNTQLFYRNTCAV